MATGDLKFGEGLLSLLSGGLQGYTQGRMYRAQQQKQAEQQRKEEERRQQELDREVEQQNRENEGQLLYGSALSSLLNLPTNVPIDDPVYNDLTQQALKGATMAGIDPAKALQSAYALSRAKRPDQPEPPSPLDAAKVETEKARAEKEKALTERYKALTQQAKQRAQQLDDGDLVKTVNALRLQRAQYLDRFGRVAEGRQAEVDELDAQIDAYNKELVNRQGIKVSSRKNIFQRATKARDILLQNGYDASEESVKKFLENNPDF